ncbi:MAG: SPOR domain-containing protein [Kangiella sp.]|nr:SPOR domain-containing protein [Kangiella sp.]MCW9028095.1 SPOR domain-containing protein [Kangiella sp.]
MDEKLKYRLVGASVILALAVFFLPMILDSEKYRSQIESQIPAVPTESESQQPQLSGQQDKAASFDTAGPVEKGPLVINLEEDTEPEDEVGSVKSNNQNAQEVPQENNQAEQQVSQPSNVEENTSIPQDGPGKPAEVQQQKPGEVTKTEAKPKVEPKPEPRAKSEQSTESDLAFSDSAWLIQIGSFSNKQNATNLVNSLRDQGYRAYQRVGDSYARVYVGPYPVKSEAEQRTGDLEKVVGSKVKVIEFDPKQH